MKAVADGILISAIIACVAVVVTFGYLLLVEWLTHMDDNIYEEEL